MDSMGTIDIYNPPGFYPQGFYPEGFFPSGDSDIDPQPTAPAVTGYRYLPLRGNPVPSKFGGKTVPNALSGKPVQRSLTGKALNR